MSTAYPEAHYVLLCPYPWGETQVQTVLNRMKRLEEREIIRDKQKSGTDETHLYKLKFDWMKSFEHDVSYEIQHDVSERAPYMIAQNIDEIAKHYLRQPFEVGIFPSGLIHIKWRVPLTWKSTFTTQRIMERFVSIAFFRAFRLTNKIEYDLFNCPYWFVQGFSYGNLSTALADGIRHACEVYDKYVDDFRLIHDWKAILVYRTHCRANIDQVQRIRQVEIDPSVRNEIVASLHRAEMKMTLGLVDCLVNGVVLWELGDVFDD
jgi:hypothetical protein